MCVHDYDSPKEVIRLPKPVNSESQARSASMNGKNGKCGKGHTRYIHWHDVQLGNLDCATPGCNSKYSV